MRAPSERHLEDWIVANPDKVLHHEPDYEPDEYWDGYAPLFDKIVSRQTKLPSGISDLIVTGTPSMYPSVVVVELKKGPIDAQAVAQCLRYMRDLRQIYYYAVTSYHPGEVPLFAQCSYGQSGIVDNINGIWPEISGMVIGHGIKDENLMATCEMSHIEVVTYDYDGTGYTFEASHRFDLRTLDICREFAEGAIGEAMRNITTERQKMYEDWQRRQS